LKALLHLAIMVKGVVGESSHLTEGPAAPGTLADYYFRGPREKKTNNKKQTKGKKVKTHKT